ncbi:chlorohydrolase [Streptococcus pneumoniae]|uniref:chlorohydrolase n=1 Tax=Streptococcus pneumoniae TaxID=1313 RepID=UPI0015D67496|nr:chlorohydrolase [Streptococcus pneumoniae]
MKIKEQTRKLAAGCSKHCFEVADRTDTKSAQNTVLRLWIELTKSVTIPTAK